MICIYIYIWIISLSLYIYIFFFDELTSLVARWGFPQRAAPDQGSGVRLLEGLVRAVLRSCWARSCCPPPSRPWWRLPSPSRPSESQWPSLPSTRSAAWSSRPSYGKFSQFQTAKFQIERLKALNKYVAHLSLLSRISNCQGLGRKSKS